MQAEASRALLVVIAAALVAGAGCSSPERRSEPASNVRSETESLLPEGARASEPAPSAPAPVLAPEPSASEALAPEQVDFGSAVDPSDEVEVCASVTGESELRRLYLAFALDVSASMGSDAQRFALKWQPVVQAAEAFFSERESTGVSASLTFFPAADSATSCGDAAYAVPDVPQTLLPSDAFTDAIGALALTPTSRWRMSTPTLAAFNGTAASLAAVADPSPQSASALVLVTDGVPQGCSSGGDDLAPLVDAVRRSGVLTFVVGVGNPAGSGLPDNLGNLDQIAVAGGTERAFVVQTGDAVRTEADFKAVIDGIRGIAVPCTVEIPLPPAGAQFIADRINVTYVSAGGTELELSYDAECSTPNGWRYDNPDAPASIVLCDDACGTARRDIRARLSIEFGCERRNVIR